MTDDLGRVLTDRAGGLRPEPAAQSQPAGAHPSRYTLERYDKICTRILDRAGVVTGLIEGLANGRWAIFVGDRRYSPRSFSSVKEAFAWWREHRRDSDGSGEAGETGTGSTEGNSAGPKDIAR